MQRLVRGPQRAAFIPFSLETARLLAALIRRDL